MLQVKLLIHALALMVVLSGHHALCAEDPSRIRWLSDVDEAWRLSQSQNRPLLVFVTRTDCVPCAKMKTSTFADRNIVSTVNGKFVALTIDAARPSPLLKDLAVNAYPATFVISPEAVILQRIDGFVLPEKFSAKLSEAVAAMRQESVVQPVSTPASPR